MRRHLASLCAGAALAACAQATDRISTSEAAHTEGAPLVDAPAIVWANESFEDFDRLAGNGATWLPADHPLVVRLQFWADALFAAASALEPEIAAHVPSPKIAIQRSDVQNAWVSPIVTSWPLQAEVDGAGAPRGADAGAPDDAHLLANMYGEVQRVRWETRAMTPTADDRNALFAYLNSNFGSCHLSDLGGPIVFRSCLPRPDAATGGKFAYIATSRWVTLTTGRISFFHAEYENVATIAHELGHYFRAHVSTPLDRYNYFYSLDDMSPGKPPPDPRFVEATARFRAKLLDRTSSYAEERLLMQRQHLGIYTTEQEADELGMEMLVRVGLAPTWIQDKQLHAMQPGSWSYQSCVALRAAGWKDANGDPDWVDEGSPADEHHDNCWRVFNADREMAIHHYPLTPAVTAPAPPGDWEAALAAIP